jgi:putative acetyltransferase
MSPIGADISAGIGTRFLTIEDGSALIDLYRQIAIQPAGFIRASDEITTEFIDRIIRRSQSGGVGIAAFEVETGKLVGAIHARRLGVKACQHVLKGLTIGVSPDFQTRGIGRRLFFDFLEHIQMNRPDILRIELSARDSQPRQIEFYESVGFRREGYFENRIRNPNGEFEAEVAMAWIRRED